MSANELTERLNALKQRREKVFARVSWWENHRAGALVPMAALSFGAGYAAGYGAHLAFSVPYQVGYLAGVAMMFAAGRAVERYTNPSQLPLLDVLVAKAERQLREATRESPSARG